MKHEHHNTQNERVTVETCESGAFAGQMLLIIWDDRPPRGSGKSEPMLLDINTIRWLENTALPAAREYLAEQLRNK